MELSFPAEGAVVSYNYLWRREASKGETEGRKSRPCAVVLAVSGKHVAVVPITHSLPSAGSKAILIPMGVKRTLGLDDAPSWIITSEANMFRWPGHDLVPLARGEDSTVFYGSLPPRLLASVTTALRENAKLGNFRGTSRN